jgi:hypothetical protein
MHSRRTGQILAFDPKDASAEPEVFYQGTPAWYFSVSPGGERVALGASGRFEIRNRQAGEVVLSSPTPGERGLLPPWSPERRLVASGDYDDLAAGLRLLDVQTGRTVALIRGQYTRCPRGVPMAGGWLLMSAPAVQTAYGSWGERMWTSCFVTHWRSDSSHKA